MPTAEVNGTTLAYREGGSGRLALLLLHGALVSHTDWEPQWPAFAADYHLVAPDLRGHGRSGRDGRPYSMRQFAGDAVALLDILGIDRVAAVGHSMGGMVAQEIALGFPDRLWALVLAETSYGIRSTWVEALLTSLTVPLLRYYSVERQANLYARALGRYTAGLESYVRREIGILADEAGGGSENVWAIWQAVMQFASKERLPQIGVPTLVLVGEHFRQTHGQGQTMARLIPGAKFGLIEGAGHMLNWDNAGQFNAEVLSFLAETCGQAPPSVL